MKDYQNYSEKITCDFSAAPLCYDGDTKVLTTCHNLTCVEGAWETTNACNKLCASVSTRIINYRLLPSCIINVRHFKATVESLDFLFC